MPSEFQKQLKEILNINNTISYKDINEILNAFQIAPGQGFAIGKTKAILEHLKSGNLIIIENFENTKEKKTISSTIELAQIFNNIDNFIDLPNDKDFKQYFS